MSAPPDFGLGADEPSAPTSQSPNPTRASEWNVDPTDGFDPVEFAEFLEADDSPIPANPAFKERLRQRLWKMVRDNADPDEASTEPSRVDARTRRPLSDPKLPR